MLLEKYKPKKIDDIVGNKMQIIEIRKWIRNFKPGSALMLYGPPGVGKSLIIKLLAKELDFELIESYASDNRTYESFIDLIKSSKQYSVSFKKKLFLIDEIDLLDSPKSIIELIKESRFPVVLIALNPYDKKLYDVRKICKLIKFQKLSHEEIAKFLADICKKEGIEYDKKDLYQLARISNGDIRSALIDLEFFGKIPINELGQRGQTEDIFNILRIIMKTTNIQNASMIIKNYEDIQELIMWIRENIIEEYKDINDIAIVYDYFSKADLFLSRAIKRQDWSLQKYFFDLSIFSLVLSKKNKYNDFVMYKRPDHFYKSSDDKILEKIGKKLHTSKRKVKIYIPLIKSMLKSKSFQKEFNLDENDIEILKRL
ncbi:MAG: AAA family ATPase [Candidatus Aenigmatarchaeota archaeon]